MALPPKPNNQQSSPVAPAPQQPGMTQAPAPLMGGGVKPPMANVKPPAPGNPNQGQDSPIMKTKSLPVSQFQTAQKPPDIPLEPLEMPDTHVTPEFCLEQMARVLEELAEKQQDAAWCQQHIELANAWMSAAELLLNHAVQGQQMLGDAHLKQQQLDQQHDMHMQQLSQNDQQHFQGMKQNDDQHQQKLKQNDQMHQKNLQQTDKMNQMKLKQGDDQHKVNMDFNKKKAQFSLQQQQQKARQQLQQRKTNVKKPREEESDVDPV